MKKVFEDKSYIEFRKSNEPGKIIVIISAHDYNNPDKKITNSVEISNKEFVELISDVKPNKM